MAAYLTLSDTSHDFGYVLLNDPQTFDITLSNNSGTTINITGYSGLSAPFSDNGAPITLLDTESTIVTITFDPTTANTYSQTLTITHSAGNSPSTVDLTGIGYSNTYALPNINNLACGVVKSYLIVSQSLTGMQTAIPTKMPFLNIGEIKESVDLEVGFTDIDQVDVTVAEDYSVWSEGFWQRLIVGHPEITTELMFTIMEGTDETFLFRGTIYRQDAIVTEHYLDVLSGTPTKWVRGMKFKLTTSLQVLQSVTIAALITECTSHEVVDTAQGVNVVPVGAIIASMVKIAFGETYNINSCVNNSTDIQPYKYTDITSKCNWDLAGVIIDVGSGPTGFFYSSSTYDDTNNYAWANKYANAYELLRALCFCFGVVPRLTYGNSSGFIDATPANNIHRIEFNSRGNAVNTVTMVNKFTESSFLCDTPRKESTVRIADARYSDQCSYYFNNILTQCLHGFAVNNQLPTTSMQFGIDNLIEFASNSWAGDTVSGKYIRALIVWDSGAGAYNQYAFGAYWWDYATGTQPYNYFSLALASYYYYRFTKSRFEYTRTYGGLKANNGVTDSQIWNRTLAGHSINDGVTARTFYASEVSKNIITNKSTVVWVEE